MLLLLKHVDRRKESQNLFISTTTRGFIPIPETVGPGDFGLPLSMLLQRVGVPLEDAEGLTFLKRHS